LFLVIQTGTIAAVAVAFSKFFGVLVPWISAGRVLVPMPLGPWDFSLTTQRLVAILSIVVLTWINLRGVHNAKIVQNLFTVTKIGGLAGGRCSPPTPGTTSLSLAKRSSGPSERFQEHFYTAPSWSPVSTF
jgi:hypothetical protein